MKTQECFLPDDVYEVIVAAWLASAPANISPCPVKGIVTRNEIVIHLGEQCDIWPMAIRDACIRDVIEDAESQPSDLFVACDLRATPKN